MDVNKIEQTIDHARLTPGESLPWPSLLAMAAATFVVVSGELLPTAVLPTLAAELDVSLGRAGLLVSAWAAMVVLASFPLARATARFDRPLVIAVALVVFAVATLVTAASTTYAAALASRLVAAAATGLLWSTINAHAAAIVAPERVARAAAVVLAGGSLGTVAAIPAGNALVPLFGWRLPFVALAVLALVTAGVLARLLRKPQSLRLDDPIPAASGMRPRLGPVLVIAGLGGMVLTAHFAAFTFVAELLAASTVPTAVLLLVFGVVGWLGVVLVGATSDRFPGSTPVVMATVMAVSLAALTLLGGHRGVDLVIVVVWGLVTGAVGPAVQGAVMRRAGAAHRSTAGTLMPVAMNLGIAVGAAAGSAVVDLWSVQVLPLLAVAPAILAASGVRRVARPA